VFFGTLKKKIESVFMSLRTALALTLGAAALYALTLFPGAGPTLDSLEFQTAVTVLGVVHPPGSPLYLLLGKLFTLVLPAGDVALRLNLFSALTAGLAVGILYLLVERLTGRRLAAALAALLLALSPQYWYQAIIAEIWSLNAVFLGAVLLLWVFWLDTGMPRWRWLGLALFALSLGNHASTILLFPALLFSGLGEFGKTRKGLLAAPGSAGFPGTCIRGRCDNPAGAVAKNEVRASENSAHSACSAVNRSFSGIRLRSLLAAGGLLLLAALPYFYIPLRAPHAGFCNYCPRQGAGLLAYFTAYPIRNAFLSVPASALPGRLADAGGRLIQQFGLAGLCLRMVGAWRLARPDRSGGPARFAGVWLFPALAVEAAFALTYDVPDWPEFLSPAFSYLRC